MSVVSYLECGCGITNDGGVEGREYCPDCAGKLVTSCKGNPPHTKDCEPKPTDPKDCRHRDSNGHCLNPAAYKKTGDLNPDRGMFLVCRLESDCHRAEPARPTVTLRRLSEGEIMRILNRLRPAGIFHVRQLGRDFKRDVFPLLEAQLALDKKQLEAQGQNVEVE